MHFLQHTCHILGIVSYNVNVVVHEAVGGLDVVGEVLALRHRLAKVLAKGGAADVGLDPDRVTPDPVVVDDASWKRWEGEEELINLEKAFTLWQLDGPLEGLNAV